MVMIYIVGEAKETDLLQATSKHKKTKMRSLMTPSFSVTGKDTKTQNTIHLP